MENENPRILVLWKTRIREFSFCGKQESENLWKTRTLVLWKRRILVLWKTRIGEFSFCGKRESENARFVENENPRICGKRECEKSRFVENEHPRILVLWKTRIR